MSVATVDLLNASLPCSRVSSMRRFSQKPRAEGDSGTTSFSPSPTQLELPNSPRNTQLNTQLLKTVHKNSKNCSFFSETRNLSETKILEVPSSETSLEEETTLEEENLIVELNSETAYSPPKSFAGTNTQFTTQRQPSCFDQDSQNLNAFTQKTTQGSHFTQFIKLKKPMFKQTQDVPFKLSPDYDHDKNQHQKKFKAVMKQLKSRRNRYYSAFEISV